MDRTIYEEARLYLTGENYHPLNYREGIRLLQAAAQGGDSRAMAHLGQLLFEGNILLKNQEAALYWFRQAVQVGNEPLAHMYLGDYAFLPIGRPKSEEEAFYHYGIAARSGLAEAMRMYGSLLYDRGQLAEAFHYLKGAVEGGTREQAHCLYFMGCVCERKEGPMAGEQHACRFYEAAARLDHVEAMYSCGRILLRCGDRSAAENWFSKAAEKGHEGAKKMVKRSRIAQIIEMI